MAYVKPARPGGQPGSAATPAWASSLKEGVAWMARLEAAKAAETERPRAGPGAGLAADKAPATPVRSPGGTPERAWAPPPMPAALEAASPRRTSAKRVLLIDSDSVWTGELSRELAARGLLPRTATDGQNGLDLARLERPDVVVLCAELSDTSGYAICSKLKKDRLLRTVPIIITSEAATPETFQAHRKLKVHAEDYLFKPVGAAELLQSIVELVLPPEEDESVELPIGALQEVASPEPAAEQDVLEEGFEYIGDESDLDGDRMLSDAEELKALDDELEQVVGAPPPPEQPTAPDGAGLRALLAARRAKHATLARDAHPQASADPLQP